MKYKLRFQLEIQLFNPFATTIVTSQLLRHLTHFDSTTKEPNIIRGGTPYLSHCDATYVAPPAGGNAVDVLSVDHSISYVVEE